GSCEDREADRHCGRLDGGRGRRVVILSSRSGRRFQGGTRPADSGCRTAACVGIIIPFGPSSRAGGGMSHLPGRRLPLSLPRRWIDDLMAASRRVPLVTFERRTDVSAVAAARAALSPAPAWSLLFLKAF